MSIVRLKMGVNETINCSFDDKAQEEDERKMNVRGLRKF